MVVMPVDECWILACAPLIYVPIEFWVLRPVPASSAMAGGGTFFDCGLVSVWSGAVWESSSSVSDWSTICLFDFRFNAFIDLGLYDSILIWDELKFTGISFSLEEMCLLSTLNWFSLPSLLELRFVVWLESMFGFLSMRFCSELFSVLLIVPASMMPEFSCFGRRFCCSILMTSRLLLGVGSYCLRLVMEKFLSFSVILFFDVSVYVVFISFAPSCSNYFTWSSCTNI